VPSAWAKNVKSAVLHVVSLARVAIIGARGLDAKGSDDRRGGSTTLDHNMPAAGARHRKREKCFRYSHRAVGIELSTFSADMHFAQ